jgi:hypothetical protein
MPIGRDMSDGISSRAPMLYLPTLSLRGGRLARVAEFSTADAAFRGSLGDAVRWFGEHAGLSGFHLALLDGDPLADATRAAIGEAREHGATNLLVEGGIADVATCERLTALSVSPVATAALAGDPKLTLEWREGQPRPVYVATDAEVDQLAELIADLLPAGVPPLLYRPRHPSQAGAIYHRLRSLFPHDIPFVVAAPPVSPSLDSIEAQMSFVRRVYRDGLPAIAVDGEWFIDFYLT